MSNYILCSTFSCHEVVESFPGLAGFKRTGCPVARSASGSAGSRGTDEGVSSPSAACSISRNARSGGRIRMLSAERIRRGITTGIPVRSLTNTQCRIRQAHAGFGGPASLRAAVARPQACKKSADLSAASSARHGGSPTLFRRGRRRSVLGACPSRSGLTAVKPSFSDLL